MKNILNLKVAGFNDVQVKIVKTLPAQPGDMVLKQVLSADKQPREICLFYHLTAKHYIKSLLNERLYMVGEFQDTDDYGYTAYFFLSENNPTTEDHSKPNIGFTYFNYKHYIEICSLIDKPADSFKTYINKLIQDECFDTSLWPDDFNKK